MSLAVLQVGCIAFVAPDRAVASPEEIVARVSVDPGPHADAGPTGQDKAVGKVVRVADKVRNCPAGHILAVVAFVFDLDVFAIPIRPWRVPLYVGNAHIRCARG